MTLSIKTNALTGEYCREISEAFAAQGWNKPEAQYLKYMQETPEGTRTILLAEVDGEYAGYLTVVWSSDYQPFRQAAIPEIVDFNVLKKYQRQGIGNNLMDEAEGLIGLRSNLAGIGVGLYPDYGPAQILYVKRGYIPDGRGISYDRQILVHGQTVIVDDSLALYFTKSLG